MKKYILLIALALAFVSTATALDPIKVAIYKPGAAVSVQININDYSSGTANPKFTGTPETLTPNGSGIIIVEIAGAGLTAIPAGDVNSHYVVDVIVESALYAQYRLDKLIIDQAQGGTYDIDGNITPSENGAGSIGTDEKRWGELFVEGNTVHIGPALGMAGNELAFSYDDGTNTATMTVAGEDVFESTDEVFTFNKRVSQDIGNNNTAFGNFAFNGNSTGNDNTAFGNGALLSNEIGDDNTAFGNYALLNNKSGRENTAIGNWSIQQNIDGYSNTAVGSSALTFNINGSQNTASGFGALANNTSGDNNSGFGNHAGLSITTGSDNTFVGNDAGNNGSQKTDAINTIAIGANTFTTADNQVVIGDANIIETQLRGATLMDLTGVGTRNIGVDANGKIVESAGGAFTSASGTTRANTTSDNFYVGQGDYTYVGPGQEYKMFYDRSNGSFRVGNVDGTHWDTRGGSSFAAGYNTNATGNSSVALGDRTTGSGNYSTAMGRSTTANGDNSTAMGRSTTANGDNSTAIGYITTAGGIASTAIGYITTASGDYSTAIGIGTIADETESVAMGKFNDNTVTGELLTIGNGADVLTRSNAFEVYKNGDVVVPALGGGIQNLQVDATGKLVVGGASAFTVDAGNNRVYRNDADDDFIFGDDDFNHTSGFEYKMFFDKSKGAFRAGATQGTEWNEGTNIGEFSIALGLNTKASGSASIALGEDTKASGTGSTAMGFITEASGLSSTAMGDNTVADENESTAMGKYNDNTVTGELLTVGNGTFFARSNAFEVYKNGNVVIGDNSSANHTVKGIMKMNEGLNANGSSSSVAVHFSVTAPTNPIAGSLWYDTGASALKIWNGGAWVAI